MTDDDILRSLLSYLRAKAARPDLAYADAPRRLTGGFDATITRFSLQNASAPFAGPLVLRLFQPTVDSDRALREGAVHNALADLGFPAPRVIAAEASIDVLGGPFLIMELVRGRPLGSEFEGLSIKSVGQALGLLRQLPRVRRELLRVWDDAQTRLHAVPTTAFAEHLKDAGFSPESYAFDLSLSGQRAIVDRFGLSGLRPLSEWLESNRPRRSQPPAVNHGDFQPLNVLADNSRLTGVIDWPKATIADPAFDYGAALAILATIPVHAPALVERMIRAFMTNMARTHARRCRSSPGGEDALRYYQAYNCLVQLVTVGKNRAQGNMTQGAFNSTVGVANLVNHMRAMTGLQTSLPPANSPG